MFRPASWNKMFLSKGFSMNGFLNYAARAKGNRRGAAYGMASTCVAAVVLTVPGLLLLAAGIGEIILARPGLTPSQFPFKALLLIAPPLAMIALPIMGLILGAAGIALSKRDCQLAVAGMIVNLAALAASLWSILGQ